ncbi:sulfite exporter TauE/SafE family protein [Methanospirillum sp. J.3.6.1-F.2.7.3]|uniref:Probable membrane transporter protein n=2 Tax=Methanospirillum TaxID=2202 RepID=A0A8E7AX07_9EURY|nr:MULTISPECIES: sulfite exporter TauE/SafE family protein [Methanospirillum]MDX8550581.1 sulfite exporter TauE/SafE family protein [Methanospirillum hungatei]QVV88315.1 sulfite exporter TauE/SafE family protein [Methanospirillum sp. J.3.6.1-F.2.7.3]QXO95855.1 sulfite exporter TauE/SafE family protein [Methanospirillum hungatei]
MNELIEFFAACIAGILNAVAGGGTLVSFPVLIALGIPPITANITNTLALCPGYFGGIIAQRKEFKTQKNRLWQIIPISILGGLIGGFLLVHSDEQSFRILIPYLILFATLLLVLQVPIKRWIQYRSDIHSPPSSVQYGGFLLLFLSSVYGGYFGAGVSVIVIAVLGLLYDDSLASLNILKLAISFSVNVTAAVFFIFSGTIEWLIVLVMSVGSILGGLLGGTLVEKINPDLFRWVIICVGLLLSGAYFYTG